MEGGIGVLGRLGLGLGLVIVAAVSLGRRTQVQVLKNLLLLGLEPVKLPRQLRVLLWVWGKVVGALTGQFNSVQHHVIVRVQT